MPQNKLKEKVEALTKTIKQLIEDFIKLDTMTRGTLTALQLHLGEEEWNKVIKQLQEREQESKPKEKKLEL
jgi:gas vesicle protein